MRRFRSSATSALFLILSTLVSLAASGYKPVTKYDPGRKPENDLLQAEAEAQSTHRHILIDVGGEWCIWCKVMDDFFATHKDLRELRDQDYVWMKVNFSRDNENRNFLSQFPSIPGYPHLFVLDENGKLLHSQPTSPLEQGKGYSAERMRDFLIQWAPSGAAAQPGQGFVQPVSATSNEWLR
jgi:thioredoxin-related protein